ncbi:glycine cleavage T C-terminal barrel domain-containing protein [Gymnodinialimonas hymeniacidonis]|uniref:glycine cleavage T C-terminal barrel domain-containing protein n=1 Tax=Gymnodinialimonas hymeniacidonis TaxID=3126508 RepID=UPI0034C5FB0D
MQLQEPEGSLRRNETINISKDLMSLTIGIGPNIRKSAYFDSTLRDGVQSFSVYNHMLIPGHFGDPEGEYDRLLNSVAQWDVAAQRQVQMQGTDAGKLAQYLTPRDLTKTKVGQGRYVPLCDHQGWLINDPVLLKLSEETYWLSVADSDIHLWAAAIAQERGWDVRVTEPDVSPMAIQGPKAIDVAERLFGTMVYDLKNFGFIETTLNGIPLVLAKSGWSKQSGFEFYLRDSAKGAALWGVVKEAGQPFGIGPGAPNDIERLESGLISYGADIRWQHYPATPYEIGLGGLVNLEAGHEFIGRAALEAAHNSGPKRQRVGLVLDGTPAFPGHPCPVLRGSDEIGYVSEFAYSKRVGRTIGVGLVTLAHTGTGTNVMIELPYGTVAARIRKIPFV